MKINQDKCVRCGNCIEACTMDAIEWDKDELDRDVVTITEMCVDCYCPAMDECPTDAIEVEE